jgi:hypothetical protein
MRHRPRGAGRVLIAAIGCAITLAFAAPAANASSVYRFDIGLQTAAYAGTATTTFHVDNLDTSKNGRVRWLRGAVEQSFWNFSSGNTSVGYSASGLMQAGDKIEVQQPQGSVVDTFTVPQISASAAAGSPTVTGTFKPGPPARLISIAAATWRPMTVFP